MDKFRMIDNKLIWHPDYLDKWKTNNFFFPIHLDIGSTSSCNYKCVHCFYQYLSHKKRSIPEKYLLPLMEDIAESGVRSIFFASQGEPLLNPATPDAIQLASKLGVDVALSTNASLLNEKMACKILPNLKWLRISVLARTKNNYCKLHGTNEKVWMEVFKNLSRIKQIINDNNLQTTIGIQTCLLPENGDEILPLVSEIKKMGIDYITLRPISYHPNNTYNVSENLLDKFRTPLEEAEKMSDNNFQVIVRWNLGKETKIYSQCLGLPFIAFVNADGGIYTCGCHLDEEAFCYGNIYEQKFSDIWKSEYRKTLTKKSIMNPDFTQCDILCGHHSINKFLWYYEKKEPEHVNFI
ncbi:radical SAM domain protein [Candidatus Magnetomorum sp. HK-1]|nr:radical SAM domain protein [Candidatus Magnetomorum sp. HK-1]